MVHNRHRTSAYFGSAVQVQSKSILSAALLMYPSLTWVFNIHIYFPRSFLSFTASNERSTNSTILSQQFSTLTTGLHTQKEYTHSGTSSLLFLLLSDHAYTQPGGYALNPELHFRDKMRICMSRQQKDLHRGST